VISSARLKNTGWVDQNRPDTLGDKGGLIGVRLKSPRDKTPITVTITCDDIMEPSTFTGTLPAADVEYRVLPAIKYRYAKLAEINQATPVSMTFRVELCGVEARRFGEPIERVGPSQGVSPFAAEGIDSLRLHPPGERQRGEGRFKTARRRYRPRPRRRWGRWRRPGRRRLVRSRTTS
jgi:hypothetical protein